MGQLYVDPGRGRETFSFQYDNQWLNNPNAYILDPDLQLYSWPQFSPDDQRELFGVFTDSCPDRWGRMLMKRREFALARAEGREERTLRTSDFLLGVYDQHRMGGLRFKLDPEGQFLNDDDRLIAPPMTMLRDLEHISSKVEENAVDDPEYLKWLHQLIAPGSSLGGARPKAGVIDPDGQLWIAKFPSTNDEHDVGAWEMVIHKLASQIGFTVPNARIKKFSSNYRTYLSERFDREGEDRIHFTSAMTMLGESDHHEDVSYLDLAEWVSMNCATPKDDLEQLFGRMVFNVCVSNVDDHLRNHGFIIGDRGWQLSPLYDVNPSVDGDGLRLNVSHTGNPLDLNLCLEVCKYFRLSEDQASAIIERVDGITRNYASVAEDIGIPGNEILLMERAFTKRIELVR